MGLSIHGGEIAYNRRRAVELKHGHVSMSAATGNDLLLEDVPNGLGALSRVPALG